jgi:hypothetical protein
MPLLPPPDTPWPQVTPPPLPPFRCIKSLESSLKKSGPDEDDFKLIIPQHPPSPGWMHFKRRPHAYEEIMGASQEQLDWDESDMTGAPSDVGGAVNSPRPDESGMCEMIKVEDMPSTVQGSRMRVVHHQYEDVVLGAEGKDQTLGESWVGGEGAGLPRGWQQMKDEQGKDYYWHIPTGKTQYSPPAGSSPIKVRCTSDHTLSWFLPIPFHSSPVVMVHPPLPPSPHDTHPLSHRPSLHVTWDQSPFPRVSWSQGSV